MKISHEDYRKRDDQMANEIELVTYYITDFYSYADPPDEEYQIRFKNIVKENEQLSDDAKEYIRKRTFGHG